MRNSDDLPETAAVRAAVLRPLLNHFAGDTERFATLLDVVGLDRARIVDGYARVALKSYLTLFEEAARLADDPWLGARVGSAIRPGDLGPVGVLVLQSGSIWRGLQRLCRLTTALQSRTDMLLDRVDGLVSLEYRVIGLEAGRYPQDAAFSLAAVCQLIRLGFHAEWAPEEVHLAQPVADAQPLEQLFGCPVLGGQGANRLYCDAQQVDRILRPEDEDLISVILRHVGQHLMSVGAGSLVDRVRSLLTNRIGRQPVTIAAIAQELGMAQRTLERRLAQDGKSFGRLLLEERQRLLKRLESEGLHSQFEIARRLGYADATVLWRARRSWPEP